MGTAIEILKAARKEATEHADRVRAATKQAIDDGERAKRQRMDADRTVGELNASIRQLEAVEERKTVRVEETF